MGKLKINKSDEDYELDNRILQRKKIRQHNKELRKKRKIKLLKLGTLFFITDLLEESQDTMLGFLTEFELKDEYLKEGEKFLKEKPQKEYPDYYEDKRILFYKMIRKSALLEKLNIHNNNPSTILGYLLKYKGLEKDKLEKYSLVGNKMFKVKLKKVVPDKEKVELLRFCMKNGIDLNKLLKEKYTGISIHNITYEIVGSIKEELKGRVL